jgi:hypothetical protein
MDAGHLHARTGAHLADDAANYGASVTKDARGMVYGRGLVERVNDLLRVRRAWHVTRRCA